MHLRGLRVAFAALFLGIALLGACRKSNDPPAEGSSDTPKATPGPPPTATPGPTPGPTPAATPTPTALPPLPPPPTTCTPDPAPTEPGLHPAPGTAFSGKLRAPFEVVLTYVAPSSEVVDVSAFVGFAVPPKDTPIEYVHLGVSGALPAGLTTVCNRPTCNIPSGSRGCLAVVGAATAAGEHTLSLAVEKTIMNAPDVPVIGGTTLVLPATTSAYALKLAP